GIRDRNVTGVQTCALPILVQDAEDLRQAAWIGTEPAILLNIQRQPGANVIEVAESIKQQLDSLQRSLPTGVDIQVATDRTLTIRSEERRVGQECRTREEVE